MSDPHTPDPDALTLGHATPPDRRAPRPDGPGQIGRYVVSRTLGHGGMAVVYAAYDPELDRRVALKLLRTSVHDHRFSVGQARLQREAQTLARLSHPNVVQVYEVGRVDDQLFIAMELVAGQTLRAWLAHKRRPWREILKVFAAAGEGLAAAHAVGIVHRDFKPDNVLVGEDGRVRVLDFGLARPDDPRDGDPPQGPGDNPFATPVGALIGTPAYMAPEQFLGTTSDARSDQFSFCVALFEALHGVRPFAGADLHEQRLAVLVGTPVPVPPGDAPGWLRKLVLRGLQHAPEDRFPDMKSLLAALARDPAQRYRRLAAAALAVLLLGLGLGLYTRALALQQARCAGAEQNLRGVWDPPRRAAIEQALLATATPFAPAVWTATARELDAYAEQWVHQTHDACAATHLRGEASSELLDLRHACLNTRLLALRALGDVLARADPAIVENAVAAAIALPALAPCADERYLRARVKPPEPRHELAVLAVREQLARAKALQDAGDVAGSLTQAEQAVAAAAAIAYPPVDAAARHARGRARNELADFTGALSDLGEAFHQASQLGDDDLSFESGLDLARLLARQSRFDDASGWSRHAEDALIRSGNDSSGAARLQAVRAAILVERGQADAAEPILLAALLALEQAHGPAHLDVVRLDLQLGDCLYKLGRHADARARLEHAIANLRTITGPGHPEYAAALNRLAGVLVSLGRNDEARALYEQVLTIFLAAFGEHHPRTAAALNNLGYILLTDNDLDGATNRFTRALAVLEQIHGDADPQLIIVLTNLARIAEHRGDAELAISHYRRAQAIVEARLGADHPDMARVADGLGNFLLELGRLDEAEPLLQLALTIGERKRSPDDPDRASSASSLGKLRAAQGRFSEALALQTTALAAWQRSLPPDHPYLAYALSGVGEAELALGRPQDALAPLERALTLFQVDPDAPPEELAQVRFALARALRLTDQEPARARTLALAARDPLAADPRHAATLAALDAWLAAKPR